MLPHASTLNIKGESYRLKRKRKAGLIGSNHKTGVVTRAPHTADEGTFYSDEQKTDQPGIETSFVFVTKGPIMVMEVCRFDVFKTMSV